MAPHIYSRLDIARGLCAIVVFAAHTNQVFLYRLIGPDHLASQAFGTAARHAVLIFFLISGYLITLSIKANIEREGHFDAIDYLASRIARIYPPLLAAILIIVGCWWLINSMNLPGSIEYGLTDDIYRVRDRFDFSISEIWLSLTMRGGLLVSDGPLWSLYIEFQVYLIAMGIAMLLAGRLPYLRAIGAIVTFVAIKVGTQYHTDFLFFSFIWFMGAFMCLVTIDTPLALKVSIASGMLVLVAALLKPTLFSLLMDTRYGQLLQVACCGFYAPLLFTSPEINRQAEANSYLVATGGFSYSLYVMHFPLLLLALSLSQNWIGHSVSRSGVICLAAGIVILPLIIYLAQILEQPKRFKRWLLFFRRGE